MLLIVVMIHIDLQAYVLDAHDDVAVTLDDAPDVVQSVLYVLSPGNSRLGSFPSQCKAVLHSGTSG